LFKGWIGKILRVNLTDGSFEVSGIDKRTALEFIGGRGFAVKILWDELERGVDPLSPKNKLVLSTGPLTGLPIPSSGKLVVAAKSPLHAGYGDGNIGARASLQLRKCGYDVLIVEERAERPSILVITGNGVEVKPTDLWGEGSLRAQEELEKEYGRTAGILTIGQAGEKLVRHAVVISDQGRAGGRPGIGAVMGSKNLKAVVMSGENEIPLADEDLLRKLGSEGYKWILSSENYDGWIRQGTMSTVQWAQATNALPTRNFKEGIFEHSENVDGNAMEKYYKVGRKGCLYCNMQCGNLNKIKEGPLKGEIVELDYETAAMLGPNLGIDNMNWILSLNLMADDFGIDTISLGGVLAFVTEAHERGLLSEEEIGLKPEWGEGEKYMEMCRMIAFREGFGDLMAEGTRALAKKIGKGSEAFAMQVKGLEISAYECHTLYGMALAFGTSPIGAHHKDAFYIALEVAEGRDIVNRERVEKLVLMQRRRNFFELVSICRFPWVELGFDLEWYVKYLNAATGANYTWEDVYTISDRVYTLMRAFWIREYGWWGREMDYPPRKWFEEPYTKGVYAGGKLSKETYDQMLSWYYEIRGWDHKGVPRKSTFERLGLSYAAEELERMGIKLED